jgi:hypothetical protein
MRFSKPSPALIVSIIALVMATTGSAVAAVDFASRAGSVDGYSAVGASSSTSHAAGNLVATAKGGSNKGQVPNKFIADVPATANFAAPFAVTDNAIGATTTLGTTPLGTVSASCRDENNKAGIENPSTVITWNNTSGQTENYARRIGVADPSITTLAGATVDNLTIAGSNTFYHHVQMGPVDVIVEGVVRQAGANTADATCLVYGTLRVAQ